MRPSENVQFSEHVRAVSGRFELFSDRNRSFCIAFSQSFASFRCRCHHDVVFGIIVDRSTKRNQTIQKQMKKLGKNKKNKNKQNKHKQTKIKQNKKKTNENESGG